VIGCVVSDKSLWSTAVYNIFVYRICQSFSVSQHSLWNRCIQSETSTNSSVSGRMFLCFNVTLPLCVHKWTIQLFVSIVRWCFSLGGDRNWRPYRHDTASGMDSGLTHGAGELAHVGTSRRRCLPPPHSACRLLTTNEALPRCACCNRASGGRSGDAAVSLVVSSVDWSAVLHTVNIIIVCMFAGYNMSLC